VQKYTIRPTNHDATDMSYTKLQMPVSPAHFSQLYKQTSDGTFSGKRVACVLFTTWSDELKRRSHSLDIV